MLGIQVTLQKSSWFLLVNLFLLTQPHRTVKQIKIIRLHLCSTSIASEVKCYSFVVLMVGGCRLSAQISICVRSSCCAAVSRPAWPIKLKVREVCCHVHCHHRCVCVCVSLVFLQLSSSNVTMPCPSFILVGEHLIASSHSMGSIPGCMSAVTHTKHKQPVLVLQCLVLTEPRKGSNIAFSGCLKGMWKYLFFSIPLYSIL